MTVHETPAEGGEDGQVPGVVAGFAPGPGVVSSTISNLVPFLDAEAKHKDFAAREALLLSFNLDLGFFESHLLGLLRSTGARVSVIGDVRVFDPDVASVRQAGRSYHVGLVETRGSFHPKVMVLVGAERAIAAVGSGNLTLGGWQYNHEVLTVATGDRSRMPAVFADIARILESLVDPPGASPAVNEVPQAWGLLDPVAAQSVLTTARHLRRLLGRAEAEGSIEETGHRVYASWEGPLIERLPSGPVDQVFLSAPFHDPRAAAVAAILKRMQPGRVALAVQPGWTYLNPTALGAVLAAHPGAPGTVEVLRDPASKDGEEPRYRHGKVVEWVDGAGARWAMTGSPNLSAAALLLTPRSGGNHEVAVISPVPTPPPGVGGAGSLFPGGDPMDVAEVPVISLDTGLAPHIEAPLGVDDEREEAPRRRPPAMTVFLTQGHADDVDAAEQESHSDSVGSVLQVHLSRAADVTVRVQVRVLQQGREQWLDVGEMPAGGVEAVFPALVPGSGDPGTEARPAETGQAGGGVWFEVQAGAAVRVMAPAPEAPVPMVGSSVSVSSPGAWVPLTQAFVSDPAREGRRAGPSGAGGAGPAPKPRDLASSTLSWMQALDPEQLQALAREIAGLEGSHPETAGSSDAGAMAGATGAEPDAGAAGGAAAGVVGASGQQATPWLWEAEAMEAAFGVEMTAFGLALPWLGDRLGGAAGGPGRPSSPAADETEEEDIGWGERPIRESEEGLEGDDADLYGDESDSADDFDDEAAEGIGFEDGPGVGLADRGDADGSSAPEPAPDETGPRWRQPQIWLHTSDPRGLRAKRRTYVEEVAAVAPRLTMGPRLMVARIAVGLWAARNWDDLVEGFQRVRAVLATLDEDQTADFYTRRAGSLVAVALSVMTEQMALLRGDALERARTEYRSTVQAVGHLLVAVEGDEFDEALVAEYLHCGDYVLGNRYDLAITVEDVRAVVTTVMAEDPHEDLKDTLSRHGATSIQVTRPGLMVARMSGAQVLRRERAVLEVLADQAGPLSVLVASNSQEWTLAVWVAPDLVTVTREATRSRARWRHRRGSPGTTVGAFAGAQAVGVAEGQFDVPLPRKVLKHSPTAAAFEVLAAAGIEDREDSPVLAGVEVPPEWGFEPLLYSPTVEQ